jgi:chemotaxis response regulator CheB
MPSRPTVQQFAECFRKAYPPKLPDRLRWWSHVLGIDRRRFVMLLGASSADALKYRTWEAIVSHHSENAWRVDETLAELVSMYSYDWKALSARLHSYASTSKRKAARRSQLAATKKRPRHRPAERTAKILLSELSQGGPQALSRFVTNLSKFTANS